MKARATLAVLALAAGLGGGCTGTLADNPSGPLGGPRGPGPSSCDDLPETSRIPRLTHDQYDNSVADLLQAPDLAPSEMLPPDTTGPIDARLWDGYRVAAETVATEIAARSGALTALLPCTPSGDGAACAHDFVVAFGRRAFRRPLSSEEIARFDGLFAMRADLTETGTFEEGVQLLVEAFLQSPSFLLRAERSTDRDGARIPLEDHDVASRLSYMLWNSMPDDALLDAADAGRLSTTEDIRAQAERMLMDPRARRMVESFHRRWLGIEGSDAARWSEIVRDPARYPGFREDMVPLFRDETLRFVEHVVFEREGGFGTLITEPTAFVNADLAPLYGLDPAGYGAELEPATLDATQRAGIFTRLGFLASHAMYDRTSPILRGAYLQEEVLCLELGSPPPGAEMTPLPAPSPDLVTTRERVTQQTSSEACASCHHQFINPVGFAFEHFDALGAYRELDNGEAVDSTGTAMLGGREETSFAGATDLSTAIANSPTAQRCYARHWVEYAYARQVASDRCTIEQLGTRLGEDGYSILDLLVDLTQTDAFRHRAVGTETTP
ncbi:DUF1592 domain-containing protein [Sandaracinus amylolyticus]|uniref:Cellulose-binding domain protein n=1 Tax=Sandaracinus amylolyticus TaxID=927083 RepID=A0A0F6W7K9_9BACT|nr:DUF1592 domain-containing protein [Sandaracinus amylolyticus]AKF09308.1 Cellulose-binding domain protein [Sandaracinus amylolyticus]